MKKILYLLFLVIGLSSIESCKKEDGPVIGKETDFLSPQITTPITGASAVLLKAHATDTLIYKWDKADYGINIPVQYVLQADLVGNDFASPTTLATSSIDSAILTVGALNLKCIAMDLTVETVNELELRVMAYVPDAELTGDTLYSDVVAYDVTPYLAKDPLYMVGSFNGWNNGTAPRMFQNLSGLKYELYTNTTDNEWGFKFLTTLGAWTAYGHPGGGTSDTNGTLALGGDNCSQGLAAGYYRVEVDLGGMTWKTTAFSWAIIGSAPGDGWAADHAMTYNAGNDTWSVTIDLIAGAFKFRGNGSWDYNYGDSGADGTLEPSGSDISIGSAGNYTIVLNLKPPVSPVGYYSYTVTKNSK
jgi:starch-binding outer membrane protein SusE/F